MELAVERKRIPWSGVCTNERPVISIRCDGVLPGRMLGAWKGRRGLNALHAVTSKRRVTRARVFPARTCCIFVWETLAPQQQLRYIHVGMIQHGPGTVSAGSSNSLSLRQRLLLLSSRMARVGTDFSCTTVLRKRFKSVVQVRKTSKSVVHGLEVFDQPVINHFWKLDGLGCCGPA